ncbi:hypothetical protein EDD11_003325 [Mortierella claussenii]|nr:hypothetical protein EDD11_003325 [Mortierella claussenii]
MFCQGKSMTKRSQTHSRQGSHVSLNASEDNVEVETLVAQQQSTRETVESLNGQLLAAKILHIGLTRQVAQYFESRSELQALLEEIFSGSTPEHPNEDALEKELERITAEIHQVKDTFEKHRAAKAEYKEVRRYVDIWNDAVEKQVASNAKDVTKSFKKFVPFFGPKPPSYTRIADTHMSNARTFVPELEDIGLLSDIKMDTIADTSSELVIYTARFKDAYNQLSHQLEVLHKKSRVLKKKKFQCMEKLFDERCKIFSEELQAHYRSIGESLAMAGSDDDVRHLSSEAAMTTSGNHGTSSAASTGLRMALQRQHVEGNLDSYSSGASSSTMVGGHSSQELLLDTEELPSYFQHERDRAHVDQGGAGQGHRRTFSLDSPARSSTASSSLSLHSPLPAHVALTTTDSPPDYVRDEQSPAGFGSSDISGVGFGNMLASVTSTGAGGLSSGTIGMNGSGGGGGNGATAEDEDEDAQFRAYHQRYDTRQRRDPDPRTARAYGGVAVGLGAQSGATMTTTMSMSATDMPPGYEETHHHSVVDPV